MTSPGLVVVDKPAGMTSHDVVNRIRRASGTRKVGHAGTLDPMATGVLVVGVDKATRLLGHLTLAEKAYDATIRLGISTHTDDAEGEVTARTPAGHLTPSEVRAALASLVGALDQVPSTVSAVKVGGRRAYQLAREGRDVELTPRRVTVHSVDVGDVRVREDVVDVEVSVRCSSGTYIRAIARDAGETLGVGGHLTALRRTQVGPFTLDDVRRPLDDMRTLDEHDVVPLADLGERLFRHVRVDDRVAADISHGRKLDLLLPVAGVPVAMLGPGGELLALYEQRGEVAVPVAVLV